MRLPIKLKKMSFEPEQFPTLLDSESMNYIQFSADSENKFRNDNNF